MTSLLRETGRITPANVLCRFRAPAVVRASVSTCPQRNERPVDRSAGAMGKMVSELEPHQVRRFRGRQWHEVCGGTRSCAHARLTPFTREGSSDLPSLAPVQCYCRRRDLLTVLSWLHSVCAESTRCVDMIALTTPPLFHGLTAHLFQTWGLQWAEFRMARLRSCTRSKKSVTSWSENRSIRAVSSLENSACKCRCTIGAPHRPDRTRPSSSRPSGFLRRPIAIGLAAAW